MTEIARLRVTWSGTPVTGPGVSTFYTQTTVTAGWPAALKTFFTAIRAGFPNGITWTIPDTADILHSDTGVMWDSNTPGGGGQVTSTGGTTDYKPGVGIRVRWGTGGVVGGRRVTGTTFLVPLLSGEFPNGIVQPAGQAIYLAAANAYRSHTDFVPAIYSTPKPARTYKGKTLPARNGAIFPITSASIPSQETWLRSRRT